MKILNTVAMMLVLATSLVSYQSCKRDNVELDPNSAAYHIKLSESIVVPADIAVPADAWNVRAATYYAKGVQKYKAAAKEGVPGQFDWVFVAPQADLYDASNKKVGTHGAGPVWQLSGSDLISGQAYFPAKTAASKVPNSIDWLLLKVKDGTTPTGVFAGVAYIQRIATVGGRPPVAPPVLATDTAEVLYTAIYRFTRKY